MTTDFKVNENLLLLEIRKLSATEFDWADFFKVGFTHHSELLMKIKDIDFFLIFKP
jgi:hypothetical protein